VVGMEEGAYDAAFYMESSLHCEDRTKTFKEAFRLLKPGGRLVAMEYNLLDGCGALCCACLFLPVPRGGGSGSREPTHLPTSANGASTNPFLITVNRRSSFIVVDCTITLVCQPCPLRTEAPLKHHVT